MNDQHPHAGYVGGDAYTTGSFETSGFETGAYDTGSFTTSATTSGYATSTGGYDTGHFATDPLFGTLPDGYDAGHTGQYSGTQQWDTTGHVEYSEYTGQWDASAWNQAHEANAAQPTAQFTPTSYDTTATTTTTTTGQWNTAGYDSGAYDATAWNYTGTTETYVPQQYDYAAAEAAHATQTPHTADATSAAQPEYAPAPEEFAPDATQEFDPGFDPGFDAHFASDAAAETEHGTPVEGHAEGDLHTGDDTDAPDSEPLVQTAQSAPAPVTPRPVRRAGGSRGRRRTPAKRSALLTVAVPSACVMGVAGIAAASVSGLTDGEQKDDGKAVTAADPSSVKPIAANSALDTQLAALSADARDFGDRASRTQERLDLKARQEAERKKREAEAARKEALRPKFALPVKLQQLSAYYGQAGVNWMSLHTGIDFPVQYGTPVMAATDGTVRTQWNSAYGNMAIVTAKDGTETWYCHLSSTKIRSGEVKAGDVIAYSGNSGNSTGPHLHFEVRPGGGAAIDPLPWLRSHDLDPTK
ncbi:M23 family metallopeptidase [Streptomyces sp. NPDC047928]|uniref:M23 family metallopeptidase n=1 Tax=unclassified Streptomyces TaxID=2593676 RepID=UPI00371242D2